jgi:hypothetical protein
MKLYYRITGILVLLFLFINTPSFSQDDVRASLKADVKQRIGVDTDIVIDYSRPGVKGRKIWGELVPYGLEPGNNYSDGKPYPWRAGANENTTINISKDVMIEGKKLPAGKYSIHTIPGEEEWTIMFNTVNDAWGSYQYDETKDALRITVNSLEAPHCEWLTFGFEDLAGTSATAFLHWEKLKVPFKVEVAGS